MRAVLCKELGTPDKLVVEELPAPALKPGSVRVLVHAAGVNFADTLVTAGTSQEKPPLPFPPGSEIAGTVAEIGDGVTGLKAGDRVMGTGGRGGYADEGVVPGDGLSRTPDTMDFVTAAGF